MSIRRLILPAALLLGLGAAGLYIYNLRRVAQLAAGEAPVRSASVERGTLLATVSAVGQIEAARQANLNFAISGQVAEVLVEVGDVVEAGDLLATLEAADLELALAQAESELRLARLALDQLVAPARDADLAVLEAGVLVAEAQVAQASQGQTAASIQIAERSLEIARLALEQTYILLEQAHSAGADESALKAQEEANLDAIRVAELRLEQAKRPGAAAPLSSAQAALAQAQAALEAAQRGPSDQDRETAQIQVRQAESSVAQAKANLERTQLVAPFGGVVSAVNARAGEQAGGPLPAVTLLDLQRYHLDVSVDEVDVARMRHGQVARITLDALPEEVMQGEVGRVSLAAEVEAGVVSYEVRIALTSTAAGLRTGMSATTEIVVDEVREGLLVPNWAIRRDRSTGQTFVNLRRSGQIVEIAFEAGLRNEEYTVALSGLAEGDEVVVTTDRERFSLFGGGE